MKAGLDLKKKISAGTNGRKSLLAKQIHLNAGIHKRKMHFENQDDLSISGRCQINLMLLPRPRLICTLV